jgi:hypothetical protein
MGHGEEHHKHMREGAEVNQCMEKRQHYSGDYEPFTAGETIHKNKTERNNMATSLSLRQQNTAVLLRTL